MQPKAEIKEHFAFMDAAWPYRPYDSCPCGSNSKAKFCCRTSSGGWFTKPTRTILADPVTGYSHPRCYASADNSCSTKISLEHYIPEGLLLVIGETVNVKGLRFTKKDSQTFRTTALGANILCERHNGSLSGLDRVAKTFFATLERFVWELRPDAPPARNELVLFNGNDIERILLKVLCGTTFARIFKSERPCRFDHRWVAPLFEHEPWPNVWGLDARFDRTIREGTLLGSLGLGLGVDHAGQTTRIGMHLAGYDFMLWVSEDRPEPGPNEGSTYRPSLVMVERGKVRKAIHLSYKSADVGTFVRLNLHL